MALNYLKFSQISAFIVMFSVLYSPAALCSLLRVENKISYDRGLPVVQGYAGNKHFQIVIDTGSDEMMLSLDILKQWGIKTPHTQKFKDIEGKEYASEVWNIPALKLFNDNIRNIKTLVDTKFGLQASDEKFEDKKKDRWEREY